MKGYHQTGRQTASKPHPPSGRPPRTPRRLSAAFPCPSAGPFPGSPPGRLSCGTRSPPSSSRKPNGARGGPFIDTLALPRTSQEIPRHSRFRHAPRRGLCLVRGSYAAQGPRAPRASSSPSAAKSRRAEAEAAPQAGKAASAASTARSTSVISREATVPMLSPVAGSSTSMRASPAIQRPANRASPSRKRAEWRASGTQSVAELITDYRGMIGERAQSGAPWRGIAARFVVWAQQSCAPKTVGQVNSRRSGNVLSAAA